MRIVDPTAESETVRRELADRSGELHGTVGLLDINKPRSDTFLDAVEDMLRERYPEVEVRRYRKPFFTRVAPIDLREQIRQECHYVIEAVAD